MSDIQVHVDEDGDIVVNRGDRTLLVIERVSPMRPHSSRTDAIDEIARKLVKLEHAEILATGVHEYGTSNADNATVWQLLSLLVDGKDTRPVKHTRRYVPLKELTEPADGYVVVKRWWAVHPEKGAAFAVFPGSDKLGSPQCNANKTIVERLKLPEEEVKFLAVAYLRQWYL